MSRQATRHSDLNQLFATRLRQAQAEAGLKNEELAREADVSLRLLQKWRAGQGRPADGNLFKLAHQLNRPVSWFFSEDGDGAGPA